MNSLAKMKKALVSIYLSLSLLLMPTVVLPFETDQFNLPPTPLTDVGEEVSEYVSGILTTTVNEVNAGIERLEKCREVRTKGCPKTDEISKKLTELRSPEGFAKAFYENIAGGNLMTTKFGKWMNSHEFRARPARYKADYSESIYKLNPFDYATLSPTVRLYGHEFGIDKLEHLFQQGYQYFKIVGDEIKKGKTPETATAKAIQWGQKTERTYYGLLTSGVYSNADLFANYAGYKFYQQLTSALKLGGSFLAPLVGLKNDRWKVNRIEDIIEPFVADHMNEALNPSAFRFTLEGSVRRAVRGRVCNKWKYRLEKPEFDSLKQIADGLRLWDGADYGWTQRSGTVALHDVCSSS